MTSIVGLDVWFQAARSQDRLSRPDPQLTDVHSNSLPKSRPSLTRIRRHLRHHTRRYRTAEGKLDMAPSRDCKRPYCMHRCESGTASEASSILPNHVFSTSATASTNNVSSIGVAGEPAYTDHANCRTRRVVVAWIGPSAGVAGGGTWECLNHDGAVAKPG